MGRLAKGVVLRVQIIRRGTTTTFVASEVLGRERQEADFNPF